MSENNPGVSLTTVMVFMLVAATASAGYAHYRFEALQQQVDRTPPIAIVQLADFIQQMPPNPSAEDMKALYERYGNIVDRLADAGYLVLDGQAVAGAPADLYVPTEEVVRRVPPTH